VTTLLAAFTTMGAGGTAVSDIIGAGILPAAIEMMDRLTIEAAEAAVHAGYPEGAGAILITELDGARDIEWKILGINKDASRANRTELDVAPLVPA